MKYLIFTLNLLLGLFFVALTILFIAPILTRGQIQSYNVATGSMEPTLPVGTYIFVRKIPLDTLNEQMIIAFTDPFDRYTTIIHRIVKLERNGAQIGITTKGDNNETIDQWTLNGQEVQGQFFLAIPYLGYLSQFIKTPLGFFLAIGIPALLFALFQIKQIKEGIEEEVVRRLEREKSIQNTVLMIILFWAASLFLLNFTSSVQAQFMANAELSGISFSAKSLDSPTITIVPTITPSVTPTLLPTPTDQQITPPNNSCRNIHIVIEGNSEGSTNTVEVNCKNTIGIIQINNVSGTNIINYELTYDRGEGDKKVEGLIESKDKKKVTEEFHFDDCEEDVCDKNEIKKGKLKVWFR